MTDPDSIPGIQKGLFIPDLFQAQSQNQDLSTVKCNLIHPLQ